LVFPAPRHKYREMHHESYGTEHPSSSYKDNDGVSVLRPNHGTKERASYKPKHKKPN